MSSSFKNRTKIDDYTKSGLPATFGWFGFGKVKKWHKYKKPVPLTDWLFYIYKLIRGRVVR